MVLAGTPVPRTGAGIEAVGGGGFGFDEVKSFVPGSPGCERGSRRTIHDLGHDGAIRQASGHEKVSRLVTDDESGHHRVGVQGCNGITFQAVGVAEREHSGGGGLSAHLDQSRDGSEEANRAMDHRLGGLFHEIVTEHQYHP